MQGDMKRMKCKWMDSEMEKRLKGKNILVAGGTGFIGKRTVETLASCGVRCHVITRQEKDNNGNIKYIKNNLNDIERLQEYAKNKHFDAAVYMAANIPLRGEKKETYFDAKRTTLDPYLNFCEAFADRADSWIYISSVDVLGGCIDYEYSENVRVNNVATPYGLAKYCGEYYTKDVCTQNKIPYKIYRFAQVYGPDEPVVRIIPIIKDALLNNKEFTLVTKGEEKRRFLYIDDAVQSIFKGLISDRSGIYNIAGKDAISMKELIRLMENVWGRKVSLAVRGEAEGRDNVPGINKAMEELGYRPLFSMTDGLRAVMEGEHC